jgi:hypothetical protein
MPWTSRDFDWRNYPPALRVTIARVMTRAQRLTTCSLCGMRVGRHGRKGVLLPPGLKRVAVVGEAVAYAVCPAHAQLSLEELGDRLVPGWRQHAEP